MLIKVLILALASTSQSQLVSSTKPKISAPNSYYSTLLEARANFGKREFKIAADQFARLADRNPAYGEAWLSLGNCYYEMKEPAKAIEPYKKALALGHGAPENNAYNIGCCYALAGDKENAIKWVEKALALRFENRTHLQSDTDLNILHDDPRFKKLAGLPPKENASRDEKWQYDIDFLVGEMKRMHYRWSVEGLPAGVQDGAEALKKNASKLTDEQIMVGMQKLLVKLDDGHSNLRPFLPNAPLKRIPVRMYKFEEGLFILKAPSEQPELKGAKVLAIGGKPIDEMWSGLSALISRDNEQGITWIGPMYLNFPSIMRELGAKVSDDSVTLRVAKMDGGEADVAVKTEPFTHGADDKLEPFKTEGVPLYLKQIGDNFWFEPLPDVKGVYFQYNQVVNKQHETVAAFAMKLRKYLAENPVENLIIDVRHNNGGNSYYNRELIRTFVTFEAAKQGKIFLITGRNTFSAAQNFTNDVVRMTNATVVGEPSSSRPFFIGESAPFVLPYSGVRGTISTRLHTVDARDMRVWIAPDIPVAVTASDYFANKDAALDAITELIKSSPQK